MTLAQHNMIVNFIWGVADDCLRDVYVRGKYRDVILPMTVIRRIDALLEATKQDVLKMKEQLDKAKVTNQHPALCQASGQVFIIQALLSFVILNHAVHSINLRLILNLILTVFHRMFRKYLISLNFAIRSPQ